VSFLYSVGDYVIDTRTKEKVQILEQIIAWDFVSYKVHNSANDIVYKLSEEDIKSIESDESYDLNEFMFLLHLSKVKNDLYTGTVASLTNDVIPLPHQMYVLRKVVSGSNVRYVLADEVGLGKTIEAGLIFKELKSRGLVKRVLVVCPKGLVTQWSLEMQEKFNEKFHVIIPSDFEAIRRISNTENVYSQFDQVISPMDSIKPIEKRMGWDDSKIDKYNEDRIYSIINSDWDLIIIDEAHRVAGSSGEVSRHKLGSMLASASPYLLLLTATPHSGKTEPFLRLMRLLDENSFPNMNALVNEQVSKFLIRNEKREAVDNQGNKLFKNRITKIVQLHWEEKHSFQQQLYDLTTQYVSKKYAKISSSRKMNFGYIFLLIMMQRLVSSSTRAVRVSLEKRIKALETQEINEFKLTDKDIADSTFEELDDVLISNQNETKEDIDSLKEIIRIAKQAEYQFFDVKIDALLDIVDNHLSSDQSQKIVVFTEFVATQEYICDFLEKKSYSVCFLNGSMSMEERNIVISDFKHNKSVLVSTDAGGEGLNLQFANVVVNYDLPWNPMKIEQRIGRVDRIGQSRDVFVYNIVLSDTVESRVRDVLEQKLSVILSELGIDKYADVLDSEVSEANFIQAFMNSIRNPKDLEFSLKPIENELNDQLQNQARFNDILHQDNDFSDLIGSKWNENLPYHLRKMVHYYNLQEIDRKIMLDDAGLLGPDISMILGKEFMVDLSRDVIKIRLSNLDYESGYFMMWEISITSESDSRKILPIFISKDKVLRPMAGQIIWNKIIEEKVSVEVAGSIRLDTVNYLTLHEMSAEFSRKHFEDLKEKHLGLVNESIQKYLYAHKLRVEACNKIGIDNIKVSKLKTLNIEKKKALEDFELKKKIFPEFKLITIALLEV
jgi:ERCC4-related helicase